MNYPDFSDKVVSFTLYDNQFSHDFINPSFEEQGGRLFVVGQVPVGATGSGWTDGKIAAIAWESVMEYVVFDNVMDYTAAVAQSDAFSAADDDDDYEE